MDTLLRPFIARTGYLFTGYNTIIESLVSGRRLNLFDTGPLKFYVCISSRGTVCGTN